MAWYRCGSGSGVPSSLKTEMDAVLNKKWGTSTTYPPDDWPETVNLMGPLPERTVSGSVIAFSDGADAVPLKSCEVTIAPNLDGVSSVDVVSAGKNLLNPTLYDGGAYNPTVGSQRIFTESATQFSHVGNTYSVTFTESWKNFTMLIPVKYGQAYYCNFTLSGTGTNLGTSVYFVDADNKVIASASNNTTNPQARAFSVNVPSGAKLFCITFTNRGTSETTLTFNEPQLEVGSTSTEYSPYVSTTHTATLGRTIYGGEVDVVNGTGTETAGKAVLDPTETWLYSSSWSKTNTNVFYTQATHDEISFATWSDNSILLCNALPVGTRNEINSADTNMIGVSGNVGHPCITVRIDKTTCPDLASFIQYITNNQISFVYKKATPEDFTFTPVPINSRLGGNTLWGDGDLSVTYRRDIDLALAQ